jgi:hypothetical protein
MRRFIIFTGIFAIGATGWILLDADPGGRQELVDRIANAFGADTAEPPPPNWGDVATAVGEFTDADRELREVLNPALGDNNADILPVGGGAVE